MAWVREPRWWPCLSWDHSDQRQGGQPEFSSPAGGCVCPEITVISGRVASLSSRAQLVAVSVLRSQWSVAGWPAWVPKPSWWPCLSWDHSDQRQDGQAEFPSPAGGCVCPEITVISGRVASLSSRAQLVVVSVLRSQWSAVGWPAWVPKPSWWLCLSWDHSDQRQGGQPEFPSPAGGCVCPEITVISGRVASLSSRAQLVVVSVLRSQWSAAGWPAWVLEPSWWLCLSWDHSDQRQGGQPEFSSPAGGRVCPEITVISGRVASLSSWAQLVAVSVLRSQWSAAGWPAWVPKPSWWLCLSWDHSDQRQGGQPEFPSPAGGCVCPEITVISGRVASQSGALKRGCQNEQIRKCTETAFLSNPIQSFIRNKDDKKHAY